MPKNEVKLIIGAQDKASPVLGRVTKALGAVGGAYAIAEGARKAFDLSKDAAKVETVARAYRRLAASVGVDASENMIRLKEATAGTISELELMQKFNQAALLGLPLDRFDEMLSVARGAAQATGESMEYMLNSIVTGIGRQSKLMIDNLGILVSVTDANDAYAASLGKTAAELDDFEKKQAFANAVLDAGMKNVRAMGGVTDAATDRYERLSAQSADLAHNIGGLLRPAVDSVTDGMNDAIGALNLLFGSADDGSELLAMLGNIGAEAEDIAILSGIVKVNQSINDLVEAAGKAAEAAEPLRKIIQPQAFVDMAIAAGSLDERWSAVNRTMVDMVTRGIEGENALERLRSAQAFLEEQALSLVPVIKDLGVSRDIEAESVRAEAKAYAHGAVKIGEMIAALLAADEAAKRLKESQTALQATDAGDQGIAAIFGDLPDGTMPSPSITIDFDEETTAESRALFNAETEAMVEDYHESMALQTDIDNERARDKQSNLDELLMLHSDYFTSEQDQLDAWYTQQQTMFADNEETLLMLAEIYGERRKEIVDADVDYEIQAVGRLFGSLAQLARLGGAKMFRYQQGLQMAQAVMDAHSAFTGALAMKPFTPANYVFAAAAVAAGMARVGMIASQKPPQAHGGLDFVPETATYALKQGERVLMPEQNRDLTAFLKGTGGGSSQVEVGGVQIVVPHESLRDMTDDDWDDIVENSLGPSLQRTIARGTVNLDRGAGIG